MTNNTEEDTASNTNHLNHALASKNVEMSCCLQVKYYCVYMNEWMKSCCLQPCARQTHECKQENESMWIERTWFWFSLKTWATHFLVFYIPPEVAYHCHGYSREWFAGGKLTVTVYQGKYSFELFKFHDHGFSCQFEKFKNLPLF